MILKRGIYPAAVTPFDATGQADLPGLIRLIAYFESKGCAGVVIAGTNGEGPSLAAVEKRDMVRAAVTAKGSMQIILGIATSSLAEAEWSAIQARKAGADALLLMPPSYFREAEAGAICEWMEQVMSTAQLPTLVYNFPKRSGIAISVEMAERLARHEWCAGFKDSSGEEANLTLYAEAARGKALYVGYERLLPKALAIGWTGSISGAANAVPRWLVEIVRLFDSDPGQMRIKFELLHPVLERIADLPQPAFYKALLNELGVLTAPAVRLPLREYSGGIPADLRPFFEA